MNNIGTTQDKRYSITYPDDLKAHCKKNNWFDKDSEELKTKRGYDRVFKMNEEGYSIAGIASIIFIYTTGWSWGRIYDELKNINFEYRRLLKTREESESNCQRV